MNRSTKNDILEKDREQVDEDSRQNLPCYNSSCSSFILPFDALNRLIQ